MATPNSGNELRRRAAVRWEFALVLPWVLGLSLLGADSSLASTAARQFDAARIAQQRAPNDPVAGWQFARAAFDWAEFATNDSQRAAIAAEAIRVSRQVVHDQPDLAAGRYYLAMNLGQMARTKSLGALPLVSEMEQLFQRVRGLDPQFDYAGADRCLGLLYRDAPGWPVSVGSKSKARRHLRAAMALRPDYPENRLNLLESLLQWGDQAEFKTVWPGTPEVIEQARSQLAGPNWEASWADWNPRWTNLLARAGGRLVPNADNAKPR